MTFYFKAQCRKICEISDLLGILKLHYPFSIRVYLNLKNLNSYLWKVYCILFKCLNALHVQTWQNETLFSETDLASEGILKEKMCNCFSPNNDFPKECFMALFSVYSVISQKLTFSFLHHCFWQPTAYEKYQSQRIVLNSKDLMT